MRVLLSIFLVVFSLATCAFGSPETVVVKTHKTVSEEVLSRIGFMYLADLGSEFLIQGTRPAVRRLAEVCSDFRLVTSVHSEETIFLLRPLHPGDELLYGAALTAVADGLYLAKVTAAIGRVYPNPFSSSAVISLTARTGTDLDVSVFNIEGKLVRRLGPEQTGPGRYELTWDGRNDAGLDVSPGVYFVSLATRGAEASTKVVLIR